MTTDHPPAPRLRLGLLLWLSGMPGVLLVTFSALPQMLRGVDLPAPLWVLSLASLAQSGLLLALAVWAGVRLAPKVGLQAPGFEAVAAGRPFGAALAPQVLPGLIAGVLGGLLLYTVGHFAPASIVELQGRFALPILARVLYGGITEELLLRWGFMTALVWLAWRFLPRPGGLPRPRHLWAAILLSALVFGAGHLPAAAALLGPLTTDIVLFVVVANSLFGVLFGYLFWRYGLEGAMLAHGATHAVSYLVEQL